MIEGRALVYKQGLTDLRISMITRRAFVLTAMSGLFATVLPRRALAAPVSPNDPVAIVNAIYARAAKGKGDSGGAFIIESKAAKARYLSRSLAGRCPHPEGRRR